MAIDRGLLRIEPESAIISAVLSASQRLMSIDRNAIGPRRVNNCLTKPIAYIKLSRNGSRVRFVEELTEEPEDRKALGPSKVRPCDKAFSVQTGSGQTGNECDYDGR